MDRCKLLVITKFVARFDSPSRYTVPQQSHAADVHDHYNCGRVWKGLVVSAVYNCRKLRQYMGFSDVSEFEHIYMVEYLRRHLMCTTYCLHEQE